MWNWHQAKQLIEHSIAFSPDALHVMAGALVQLGASLLLRRPLSSLAPWLTVVVIAILNEVVDLRFPEWPWLAAQIGESAKDILLTLAVPTLLLATTRLLPQLYESRPQRSSNG
jgi:hypothetical protein